MLTQDDAEDKIEVLEGWLDSAGEIAREGKSTQEEAERLIGAMTDEEAEAFWQLYAEAEDILLKIGRSQMYSSDVEIEYEALRGVAIFVYARTIIDYDPDRGDLAGYLMSASRPHWRSYLYSISRSNSSSSRRRYDKLLRQLRVRKRTMAGRDPTLREKVNYLRDNNYHARSQSDEQLTSMIREVEEEEEPDSLDATIPQREGSTQTLHDVLPSPTQVSIDTEKVAQIIAEKTGREELLDALLGEEPEPASFKEEEAREIYLERESRDASSEQIAWEHETSPFLVEQIENIYDVAIPIEDVERYAKEQGYDLAAAQAEERSRGKLTDEDVWTICKRYHEEDIFYEDLAEDYPVGLSSIGDIIRRDSYQHVDRPDVDEDPAPEEEDLDEEKSTRRGKLSDEDVLEICRRYAEEDVTYEDLAEDYPASKATIGRVVTGESYQHVERPDLKEVPDPEEEEPDDDPDPEPDPEREEKEDPEPDSARYGSLTEDDIWAICCRSAEESYEKIAQDYPVSEYMIGSVARGDSYPDAPRPDVETPPYQVLTDEDVLEICRRYDEEDMTYAELAERYGVGSETIGGVVRGETHQHIDRPQPDTRSLSPQQVRDICRRYEEENLTYADLAKDYAVSPGTIGGVIRGETYTDINR